MGAALQITGQNFEQTLKSSNILILDFWAPWCGPCRAFGPIFEQAAAKYPDITFGKINTEEEFDLASQFGIRSIPTIVIFREQMMVYAQPGALSATQLDELIKKVKELDMNKVREEVAKQNQNK